MATKFAECWNKCQKEVDACIAGCTDDCCRYNCIDRGITCKQKCGRAVEDYAIKVQGFINNLLVPTEVQQLLQDMLSDIGLMSTTYEELATAYHQLLNTYFTTIGYVPPDVVAGAVPDCGCPPA